MKMRNPNSNGTWASRLRDYDGIPKGATSNEELWERLRQRLDNAPKRKSRAWYWLAAASVVLFFITLLFIPVNNKTAKPGFTKNREVIKQNNKSIIPVDTIQAITNNAVKAPGPGIKKQELNSSARFQPLHPKEESVVPKPVDSGSSVVNHTPIVEDDFGQPGRLPSVHINDLINNEQSLQPITTKGLAVKKMIRLFGVDFTKDQPSKKQENIPKSPYTIPNNQN